MTVLWGSFFRRSFFVTLCSLLVQPVFCLSLSSPTVSKDLGQFRGKWTKTSQPTRPDQPGIGAWIKFDMDDPSRIYLSWAPPMVVSDAEGKNGANFVWRNDAASCWYDMFRTGSKLIVRLAKSDPPGACMEDSVFEGGSTSELVDSPQSNFSHHTSEPAPSSPFSSAVAHPPRCGWYAIAYCSEYESSAATVGSKLRAGIINTNLRGAYPNFRPGWYCAGIGPLDKRRAVELADRYKRLGYATAYAKNAC